MHRSLLTVLGTALLGSAALAQEPIQRISVTVENLSPKQGAFLTPVWVGAHDGSFDSYTGGVPANGPNALLPNDALERIAEDGNTGPISVEFLASGAGSVDATLLSPAGPLAPGSFAQADLLIDPNQGDSRYFSYVSMVIPSNDAFIANGDPLAHRLFDASGAFVFEPFIVSGAEVNDAGTEVNDELPATTAFFGQAAPDVGVDENGVVFDHVGLNDAALGGILSDPMFAAAQFAIDGYPLAKVTIQSATAITSSRRYAITLSGDQQVPPVTSPAVASGRFRLVQSGTLLRGRMLVDGLDNVVSASLHLGAVGESGPRVAEIIMPAAPGGGAFANQVTVDVRTADLIGPLAGFPLDALVAEVELGNVYVSFATDDGEGGQDEGPGDFASGEIRGQLLNVN